MNTFSVVHFLPVLFVIFSPFYIFDHSCCVLLLFSWCALIHLASPMKVDEEGGREGGSGDRRASQRASIPFINIRISQRGALKANSETSPLPLRTKAESTQLKCEMLLFLFTPSTPFTPIGTFRLHEVIFLSKKMADKNK